MDGMEWSADLRVLDADEVPRRCPECGRAVVTEEITGQFWPVGPRDRKHAREAYGTEAQDGDSIDWIGLNAYCPIDHWSWMVPMAMA